MLDNNFLYMCSVSARITVNHIYLILIHLICQPNMRWGRRSRVCVEWCVKYNKLMWFFRYNNTAFHGGSGAVGNCWIFSVH